MTPLGEPYSTTRRVEFADTDAAGIAHFTAFMRWMEEAEHEFLRQHGLSVFERDDAGVISWPRVRAECDFTGGVHFEDVLNLSVRMDRLGEKSIRYEMVFSHAGRPVAKGFLTAVCCRIEPGKKPVSMAIPERIRAQLLAPVSSKNQ